MWNFWPCLTCNIFYTERHKKLKFIPCNQRVVLYKSHEYPFSLLITVEVTDRQTCEFFWPIEILTKFDSKKLNLPSNLFPLFSTLRTYPKSTMSLSEILKLSPTVTEKTVAKYGTKLRNSNFQVEYLNSNFSTKNCQIFLKL